MRIQELFENNDQQIGWYVITKKGNPIEGAFPSKVAAQAFRDEEEPEALVRYGRPELHYGEPKIKAIAPPKESVQEAVKGAWKIQNLAGKFKTFADNQSPDARAWMKNRELDPQVWDKSAGRWVIDPKHKAKLDREIEKQNKEWGREERAAVPKVDLQKVYNKYIEVVGNIFPDGDPADYMGPWFKKTYGVTYDYGKFIDQALKKFGSGDERKGQYAYLASMWAEMAADALHDALESTKTSGPRYDSPFIEWDKSGNPHVARNPWKVSELAESKKAKKPVPKMEYPGVKVSGLQGLRNSLEKAVKEMGYRIDTAGFEDASTVWSVAFPITTKFDIDKFEDELRDKLNLDGWLRVKFFDLVED